MKKMKRGGARKGAGRPSGQGRYGEPTKIMRVPVSMMDTVKDMMESKTKDFALPLFDMKVEAGVPNFTDSDNYELYNLGEKFMAQNPNDHFLVKVSGYSMKDAGILPDDILLVNKSKEARDGDIIVASINDGAVVKRLSQKDGVTKLISDNDDYDNIEDQTLNLHPWGVVTKVIRDC